MKLDFGMYKGKTLEWLFFHAPWYAEWLYKKEIYREQFNETDCEHFLELRRRASCVTGPCQHCNTRQSTRMGLTALGRSGMLGGIGFYCDECEYLGGGATEYLTPAFTTFMDWKPRCEKLRIALAIKNHLIGENVRLTQKRMEEFFKDDAHFPCATKGFFELEHVA